MFQAVDYSESERTRKYRTFQQSHFTSIKRTEWFYSFRAWSVSTRGKNLGVVKLGKSVRRSHWKWNGIQIILNHQSRPWSKPVSLWESKFVTFNTFVIDQDRKHLLGKENEEKYILWPPFWISEVSCLKLVKGISNFSILFLIWITPRSRNLDRCWQ